MEIEQNIWGFTSEGEPAVIYTMRNSTGAYVRLTNVGAAVVSIVVPDRSGAMSDVALGYPSFQDYLDDSLSMGKIKGRYAGIIRSGAFELNGVPCKLTRNTPPHHTDGGTSGLGNRIWQSRVEVNRVVFSLVSPDGDQGYPGELSVEVVYDWNDNCELEITMLAKSSAPTIVNLAPHIFLNLAGESSGSILGHSLKLNATEWLPSNPQMIPTGERAPVECTPMDFREPKQLGRDINTDFPPLTSSLGYDAYWVADGWSKGKIQPVGELRDEACGRMVEVFSSQPAIKVYTANLLQGGPTSKSGKPYDEYDGVSITCLGFPDAPNNPSFPSQTLTEHEIYEEHVIYRFGTC